MAACIIFKKIQAAEWMEWCPLRNVDLISTRASFHLLGCLYLFVSIGYYSANQGSRRNSLRFADGGNLNILPFYSEVDRSKCVSILSLDRECYGEKEGSSSAKKWTWILIPNVDNKTVLKLEFINNSTFSRYWNLMSEWLRVTHSKLPRTRMTR